MSRQKWNAIKLDNETLISFKLQEKPKRMQNPTTTMSKVTGRGFGGGGKLALGKAGMYKNAGDAGQCQIRFQALSGTGTGVLLSGGSRQLA